MNEWLSEDLEEASVGIQGQPAKRRPWRRCCSSLTFSAKKQSEYSLSFYSGLWTWLRTQTYLYNTDCIPYLWPKSRPLNMHDTLHYVLKMRWAGLETLKKGLIFTFLVTIIVIIRLDGRRRICGGHFSYPPKKGGRSKAKLAISIFHLSFRPWKKVFYSRSHSEENQRGKWGKSTLMRTPDRPMLKLFNFRSWQPERGILWPIDWSTRWQRPIITTPGKYTWNGRCYSHCVGTHSKYGRSHFLTSWVTNNELTYSNRRPLERSGRS